MRTAKATSQNVRFPSAGLQFDCDGLKADFAAVCCSRLNKQRPSVFHMLVGNISEFGWLRVEYPI